MDTGSCIICGAEIVRKPRRNLRKTCSPECRAINRGENSKRNHAAGLVPLSPRRRVTLECRMCSQPFEVQAYAATSAKYCSHKCSSAAKTLVTGSDHRLFKPKAVRFCEACGRRCEVKPSLASRFRFCSRHCAGAWVTRHHPRISSIEDRVAEVLDAAGITYVRQGRVGRFTPDFIIDSTIVEVDGTYWHSLPKVQARDVRKNAEYEARGYRVIRIPESAVRAGDFSALDILEAA